MKKIALGLGLAATCAVTALATVGAKDRPAELRLNQIQVLGTHNSYSQGVDKHLLAMADAVAVFGCPIFNSAAVAIS